MGSPDALDSLRDYLSHKPGCRRDPDTMKVACSCGLLQAMSRVAYLRDHPGWVPPIPPDVTDDEWDAATNELFEAIGEGYSITRDHCKGLAFRVLAAARQAP